MPQSPLERLKIEEWDRMIDVNIKGVLYGIAAIIPQRNSKMEIKRSGSQPSNEGPADWFSGTVHIDPLFQANAPSSR
jgi:NAD(P)-dependent dehydrogenase (short-subunit alcohol dehydrogenase family)